MQGDVKFEKVVKFNKKLRKFKPVHDRNMILCQESLRETSQDEESPQQKSKRLIFETNIEKINEGEPAKSSRKGSNVSNIGVICDPVPAIKIETTFPVESDTPIQCTTEKIVVEHINPVSKKNEECKSTTKVITTFPTNTDKVLTSNLNSIKSKEPHQTQPTRKEPSFRSKKEPKKNTSIKSDPSNVSTQNTSTAEFRYRNVKHKTDHEPQIPFVAKVGNSNSDIPDESRNQENNRRKSSEVNLNSTQQVEPDTERIPAHYGTIPRSNFKSKLQDLSPNQENKRRKSAELIVDVTEQKKPQIPQGVPTTTEIPSQANSRFDFHDKDYSRRNDGEDKFNPAKHRAVMDSKFDTSLLAKFSTKDAPFVDEYGRRKSNNTNIDSIIPKKSEDFIVTPDDHSNNQSAKNELMRRKSSEVINSSIKQLEIQEIGTKFGTLPRVSKEESAKKEESLLEKYYKNKEKSRLQNIKTADKEDDTSAKVGKESRTCKLEVSTLIGNYSKPELPCGSKNSKDLVNERKSLHDYEQKDYSKSNLYGSPKSINENIKAEKSTPLFSIEKYDGNVGKEKDEPININHDKPYEPKQKQYEEKHETFKQSFPNSSETTLKYEAYSYSNHLSNKNEIKHKQDLSEKNELFSYKYENPFKTKQTDNLNTDISTSPRSEFSGKELKDRSVKLKVETLKNFSNNKENEIASKETITSEFLPQKYETSVSPEERFTKSVEETPIFKSGFLLNKKDSKHRSEIFSPGFLLDKNSPAVKNEDNLNKKESKYSRNIDDSKKGDVSAIRDIFEKSLNQTDQFRDNIKETKTHGNYENNNYISPKSPTSKETSNVKNELNEISKQKSEIENKLKKLSNDNLKRLLQISPSPEEFTMTDKLFKNENFAELDNEILIPSESNLQTQSEIIFNSIYNINNVNREGNQDDNKVQSSRKKSNDSIVSNSSNISCRYRHRSGPASPEDTSLYSDKSTESEEEKWRPRRKSGPSQLKPVLRNVYEAIPLSSIKKSVTFSTPKLSSIDSETLGSEIVKRFERRNTMETIPLQKSSESLKKVNVEEKVPLKNIEKGRFKISIEKDDPVVKKFKKDDESTYDTKNELEEINKQKVEIENKLKEMNDKNLQRLLHMSPSPETLPETEKMSNELYPEPNLRPLILTSIPYNYTDSMGETPSGTINPALRVNRGHVRPRMGRPRSPYPPLMVRGKFMMNPRSQPPFMQGQMRMSPPLRPMPMHLFQSPSPTTGLIRITPRHLPPSYRMNRPRLMTPSPIHQRFPHPRMSPMMSPTPRSPLRTLRCSGHFSPIRPPNFKPMYYLGGPPSPRPLRPPLRAPSFPSVRHQIPGSQRMPIAQNNDALWNEDSTGSQFHKPIQKVRPIKSSNGEPLRADIRDIKHVTVQPNEKIIQVRGYGTVKIKTPEMATITCSDLLTAYRLSQNLTGSRPYTYDPKETLDAHRRLAINSRKIFEKLSSPRKEKKGPYEPNREILRLFRSDQRGREKVAMENEELLYKHKSSNERQGEFFGPKNADVLEQFQATHEYIRKLYIHSKSE